MRRIAAHLARSCSPTLDASAASAASEFQDERTSLFRLHPFEALSSEFEIRTRCPSHKRHGQHVASLERQQRTQFTHARHDASFRLAPDMCDELAHLQLGPPVNSCLDWTYRHVLSTPALRKRRLDGRVTLIRSSSPSLRSFYATFSVEIVNLTARLV